jgi:predicted TIM-barrel fold metal-dependent hydrolase
MSRKMKTKAELMKQIPELHLTDTNDFCLSEDVIGRYEVIDFHTHVLQSVGGYIPRLLKRKRRGGACLFDLSGYPGRMENFDFGKVGYRVWPETLLSVSGLRDILAHAGPRAIAAIRSATPSRLLKDMASQHIGKSVILPINAKDHNCALDLLHAVNSEKAFVPFASVHPLEKDIERKIAMYVSLGIKGFKINPHVMKVAVDDPAMIDAVGRMAETGLPVVSCSGLQLPGSVRGVPAGIARQLETQNIERFGRLLSQVPGVKLVLAHGGLEQNALLIELMKKYPHTYTDISTQPARNIRRMVDELGSERLLFGSDYPYFNQCFPLLSVLKATVDENDRTRILSLNAKSLLGI